MNPTLSHTPNLLEMYHFRESVETLQDGLRDIDAGLKRFDAAVTNLRVLFHRMQDLYVDLEECGIGESHQFHVDYHGSRGEEGGELERK